MFPLFKIEGGNKISLRWNIPFSDAVCTLAKSNLLVWQNSGLSEASDFLKGNKVKFGTNTCFPCHSLPSGVICKANVLPAHKRAAHESLFCITAELWLWTVAFLLTVLPTRSLISPLASQCNRQLQMFFKAHKCHVAHRKINCSHHSGIFKEEKHSLEKTDAKQFLMWSDTEDNLQNITLDPKVKS